jgi:hypothetical protein
MDRGGSTEHLARELGNAHGQLFEVRKKMDNLLEMYGGCLETIEELRLDNDDLRALCKEQVCICIVCWFWHENNEL